MKTRAKPAFSKTYAAAAARRVIPSCNLLIATWYERHRRKHHIRFEIAKLVFYDPNSITEEDDRFDYGEKRYWTLGMVESRYLLLYVAHTIEDDEEVIRIISARKAEPHERMLYDKRKSL